MMLEMTFLGWKTEFEGSSWINVFNDDADEEENSFHLDIITDKGNILFYFNTNIKKSTLQWNAIFKLISKEIDIFLRAVSFKKLMQKLFWIGSGMMERSPSRGCVWALEGRSWDKDFAYRECVWEGIPGGTSWRSGYVQEVCNYCGQRELNSSADLWRNLVEPSSERSLTDSICQDAHEYFFGGCTWVY